MTPAEKRRNAVVHAIGRESRRRGVSLHLEVLRALADAALQAVDDRPHLAPTEAEGER